MASPQAAAFLRMAHFCSLGAPGCLICMVPLHGAASLETTLLGSLKPPGCLKRMASLHEAASLKTALLEPSGCLKRITLQKRNELRTLQNTDQFLQAAASGLHQLAGCPLVHCKLKASRDLYCTHYHATSSWRRLLQSRTSFHEKQRAEGIRSDKSSRIRRVHTERR